MTIAPPIPVVFSAQHLNDLIPGQRFKTEGFFQGVTDDPVKWKMVKRGHSGKGIHLTLDATYMGVHLGEFEAIVKSKKEVIIHGPK